MSADDQMEIRDSGRDEKSRRGRRTARLLLKLIVVLLVVVGFAYLGARFGILPEVERTAFDMRMRSNPPRERTPVVIVRITDRDYHRLFKAQSPLDPATVMSLVRAIAETGPSVIAVDLDTSDPAYRRIEIPSGPPIVWARVARREPSGKLRPLDVLGGREQPVCSGIVTLKAEADRVVRRYQRMFFEEEMDDPRLCEQAGAAGGTFEGGKGLCKRRHCPFPSFAWAVVNEYDGARFGQERARAELSEGLTINFAGNPELAEEEGREPESGQDLTAQDVLDAMDVNSPPALKERFKGMLQGKIVLFGGGYASARDRHATPLGLMTGVRINAQVIETELEGGGLPPPRRTAFMLLLAENVIFVLFFQVAKDRRLYPLLLSPILVAALALLCSLLAFGTAQYWVFFLPTLLILLTLEAFDLAKEYRNALLTELRGRHAPEHGPDAPTPLLDSVASFQGTLGEFVQRRIDEISAEHERGGRSVTGVTRTQVTTSLKPEAFRVEISSREDGRIQTQRLFFFEDSDGRKVSVADDSAR